MGLKQYLIQKGEGIGEAQTLRKRLRLKFNYIPNWADKNQLD
jgi:hypothetical protein